MRLLIPEVFYAVGVKNARNASCVKMSLRMSLESEALVLISDLFALLKPRSLIFAGMNSVFLPRQDYYSREFI